MNTLNAPYIHISKKIFIICLSVFTSVFLLSSQSFAQNEAGQTRYSGGKLEYCNGSRWVSMDSGYNAGGCSTAGTVRFVSGQMQFCNGSQWRYVNPTPINGSCGSATSGACTTSQPTSNLCNSGTFVEISDTSTQWRWRCNGQLGGSNSPTCQRSRCSTVTCGSSSGPPSCNGGSPTGISSFCTGLGNLREYSFNCGSNSCISHQSDPSCGGGGGGGCFRGDTLISMADGSTKPIKDIKAGDMVMAFDKTKPHSPLEPRKVNAQKNTGTKDIMVINGTIRVTEDHKFPSLEYGMIEVGKLKFGDHLINEHGHPVKIRSIAKKTETVPTYNIEVDGYHSYVANGYRTGNMILLPETAESLRKDNGNIIKIFDKE